MNNLIGPQLACGELFTSCCCAYREECKHHHDCPDCCCSCCCKQSRDTCYIVVQGFAEGFDPDAIARLFAKDIT